MSRPLRFVPEEYRNWTDSYGQEIAVVEITIRTLLGMFFLTPHTTEPLAHGRGHGPRPE